MEGAQDADREDELAEYTKMPTDVKTRYEEKVDSPYREENKKVVEQDDCVDR